MPKKTIKYRFAFSVGSNLVRGGLAFLTILIVARGLGPEKYGDYAFIFASFSALKILLDMGSSDAFFTFLSQKPRGKKFIGLYANWQLIQFLLPLLAISFFIPDSWISYIWVSQEKGLIIFGFIAVFMQQQAWQTMVQIGESLRLTHQVQIMTMFVYFLHFLFMLMLWKLDILSIKLIFSVLILEYVFVIAWTYKILGVEKLEGPPLERKAIWLEYKEYCIPLVLYSLLGFGYEFVDRWLLQTFSGSAGQGFFSVGHQFATVGLVAATSMLRIFWKEIAEAHENQDQERIHRLYVKVSRFLFMVATFFCGFLLPWSEDIMGLALGSDFLEGAPILAIMLLYPIHQSMGYVDATLFMASKKTKTQLVHGAIFMAVSIPASYLVQAPKDAWIPGLALGGAGLAWKLVVVQIFHSNARAWWNARVHGWKFDWSHQVIGIASVLPLGWLSYQLAAVVGFFTASNLILQGIFALFLYGFLIATLIWTVPWLIGFSREELVTTYLKFKNSF